jgi:CMP-N-acetylneuraminic acid synthetase
LNGAIYVVNVLCFLKEKAFIYPDTQAYLMPAERSLDIDSPEDLLYMKAYIEEQHGKI